MVKDKKQYTIAQRYEYHRKRRNSRSKSISANQRSYSDSWVFAFMENPSSSEIKRIESWYATNKKDLSSFYRADYQGYIDGGKAALKYYDNKK